MRSRTRPAIAAALTLAAGAAVAQGPRETRGGPAGEFDFYVLALSWSPSFCAGEGDGRGQDQCEPGRRLGFVVHGLWPQFERGYPTECGPSGRAPGRAALDEAADVFPSLGLARLQWRRHGVCSGRSPAEYFRDVRRARDAVRIPETLARPGAAVQLPALAIERAFAEANPGLRPDMMALACRRGALQEVRICLERDLRGFRTCRQVDDGGCQAGDVTVPAPR